MDKKMKLLSSASSASSAVSTAATPVSSSDRNLCSYKNGKNSPAAGCISGVVRRLLCKANLPTHPSDHFREFELPESEKPKWSTSDPRSSTYEDGVTEPLAAAPNVVARLMGLESIPQTAKSVARSRSMNAVETSREFGLAEGSHRRVQSFREPPVCRELEDEHFFILSFENEFESVGFGPIERKPEKGAGETEQRRSGKGMVSVENRDRNKIKKRRESVNEKNKENLFPHQHCSQQKTGSGPVLQDRTNLINKMENDSGKSSVLGLSKPVSNKGDSKRRRRRRQRKDDCLAAETNEPECDSQNSSPNSVLDEAEFPIDREAPGSGEVPSRLKNSKSRRTLWEELENYRKLSPSRDNESLIRGNKGAIDEPSKVSINPERLSKKKRDYFEGQKYGQIWKESYGLLAEAEILQSNWSVKEAWKLEEYKKVSKDLEEAIFDEMVDELVSQLGF